MKIYIAGPITGVLDYRQNFEKAERELKAKGHIVLSPSYLPAGLKDYMLICCTMIDQADAVYFLNGWECSIGSALEKVYAVGHDKRILFEIPREAVYPKGSEDYKRKCIDREVEEGKDEDESQYPFGCCRRCKKEFNSELIGEYDITYCPWCGKKIEGTGE